MDLSLFFMIGSLVVLLVTLVIFAVVFLAIGGIWLRGFLSGCPVSFFEILGSRMRGTPTKMLMDACITFHHRNEPYSFITIESCYLAHRLEIHNLETLMTRVPKFADQETEPGINPD